MANDFDTSLKCVLLDEGGNSDDPRDHGGRTSRGITQREYDHWCHLHNKSQGDVWNAAHDDIRSIYEEQYWQPYCDALPAGLDYLFFDISVNAGRTQAVLQFQKALGIEADGMMGVITRNAIAASDPLTLVHAVSNARRNFYRHLTQFNIYGHGWLTRVDRVERRCVAIITQTATPIPSNVTHPKATEPASKSPTTSGVTTGSLLTILAAFKEQIQGLTNYLPDLNYVILGIAVVGLGYALWSAYRNKQIEQATG